MVMQNVGDISKQRFLKLLMIPSEQTLRLAQLKGFSKFTTISSPTYIVFLEQIRIKDIR